MKSLNPLILAGTKSGYDNGSVGLHPVNPVQTQTLEPTYQQQQFKTATNK